MFSLDKKNRRQIRHKDHKYLHPRNWTIGLLFKGSYLTTQGSGISLAFAGSCSKNVICETKKLFERLRKSGLMSSVVAVTSEKEVASLALVGSTSHSSDGVTIKQ